MNDVDPARKIEALRAEIRKHERLYYVQNQPEISDEAYDRLERELRELEAEHPDLVTPDSPTQRVGEKPSDEFPTFAHRVPMLSLDNTFGEDELREFDEEERATAPSAPRPLPVIAPWKVVAFPLAAAAVLLVLYYLILGRRGPARS